MNGGRITSRKNQGNGGTRLVTMEMARAEKLSHAPLVNKTHHDYRGLSRFPRVGRRLSRVTAMGNSEREWDNRIYKEEQSAEFLGSL